MCRCDLFKNTSGNVRLLLSSYLLLVILWITLDTHYTGTYTPRGIKGHRSTGRMDEKRQFMCTSTTLLSSSNTHRPVPRPKAA